MNDDEQQGSGQDGQQGGSPAADANPIQAYLEQLNNTVSTLAEENRHNRELLNRFAERMAPASNRQEANDEDDEPAIEGDLADDLAENGLDALTKRGVLTKKQAKDLIRQEASKIARDIVKEETARLVQDAELARDFPGLNDPKSDLFKRTQAIYQEEVKADPSLKNNSRTLLRAAKEAQLDLMREEMQRGGRSRHDDDEELDRRIDRQGNFGSAGRSRDYEESSELSPSQRRIIEKFAADGDGLISVEGYKKRAAGVTVSGLPKNFGGKR